MTCDFCEETEPFRNVFCDMCEHFRFPAHDGIQKGLCPMVMDEVGRKFTYARECSEFTPARRCGCCAHYVTPPYQKKGKCEMTDKRISTGSTRAVDCMEWEMVL